MKYIALILSLFFVGCATTPPIPLTPENVAATATVKHDAFNNSTVVRTTGEHDLWTIFIGKDLQPYVAAKFWYYDTNGEWLSPSYAMTLSNQELEVSYVTAEVYEYKVDQFGSEYIRRKEAFVVYFPFDYIEGVLSLQKDIYIRVYGNFKYTLKIPYAAYSGLILKTGEVKKELISGKF